MVAPLFPMTAAAIEVRRGGTRLLGPIDIQLEGAGITAVLGPNGAGKTTFLRAIHGLARLTEGSVSWAVPEAEARGRQAFVFQTPILLRRSVRGNLAYPLQVKGLPKNDIRRAVEDWAGRIGLEPYLDRRAALLSGGEKQKLAIARALIGAPEALFLDEPCTNLDGRATREIETLLQMAQANGTGIILATHDLGQARRLANTVIFLLDGKVHEIGPAINLFSDPQTNAFRAFLAGEIIE